MTFILRVYEKYNKKHKQPHSTLLPLTFFITIKENYETIFLAWLADKEPRSSNSVLDLSFCHFVKKGTEIQLEGEQKKSRQTFHVIV